MRRIWKFEFCSSVPLDIRIFGYIQMGRYKTKVCWPRGRSPWSQCWWSIAGCLTMQTLSCVLPMDDGISMLYGTDPFKIKHKVCFWIKNRLHLLVGVWNLDERISVHGESQSDERIFGYLLDPLQGGRRSKTRKFCGRPLCMTPYETFSFNTSHNYISSPSNVSLNAQVTQRTTTCARRKITASVHEDM